MINARLIHSLDFDAVRDRLPAEATRTDWELVRPNLTRVNAFASWLAVRHGEIEVPVLDQDERSVAAEAATIAPGLDWSAEPWKQLTSKVKEATGKKGRELFHPLRLAITGLDSGPEMAGLIQAIGKERVTRRLEAAARR